MGQIQKIAGSGFAASLKRERPWASITFSGTRHLVEISCSETLGKTARARLVEKLPEQEFDLPGHFVADFLIRQNTGTTIEAEVLTIIDPVKEKCG